MTDLLLSHGNYLPYLVIVAILILSSAGIPVPEEVTVVAAGILSSHAELEPWFAFAVCWVGALAGDCLVYYLGYHFGENVVREHHWWVRVVTPKREARMEELIHRHGWKVLFAARFLVGVRSPVYLAAGILRLSFRRFLLTDLVSATLVISLFFWLSYYFGVTVTHWLGRAEILLTVLVVLLLVGGGAYLWHRHRNKLRRP